jgi:hypothetical protein
MSISSRQNQPGAALTLTAKANDYREHERQANPLLTRDYRKGFVVWPRQLWSDRINQRSVHYKRFHRG